MNARVIQIADAVVDRLKEAPLSRPIDPQRRYLPRLTREQLAELRVTVVPLRTVRRWLDRSRFELECVIAVAVQEAVSPEDVAAIDGLVRLTEEIADYFHGQRLPTGAAICMDAEVAIFDTEHLKNLHAFTGVASLTFRAAALR